MNADHTEGPRELRVEFAGERFACDPSTPFVVGRGSCQLSIDDNPYLHRQFLQITFERDLWWLANVGSQLTATVSDVGWGMHAWLSPGGKVPLTAADTAVTFTAGPTQYEITFHQPIIHTDVEADANPSHGTTTLGRVTLTADQHLMLLALAEPALRRGSPTAGDLPSSAAAARRLGWTLKKFEKKLDNVCEKLTTRGVRGLKGEAGNLASSRRARLVEYAVGARLVRADDLHLLDDAAAGEGKPDDD